MNTNYIIPLTCGLGGGLIYRHFYDMYLNSFNYKNDPKYALMTYQHYDNIYNVGMVYGLGLGILYVFYKNIDYPLIKIDSNFS